jgi:hypothetical protein
MVSRGCRTCVQRRVKCDTANPICERCTKGKRTCVWDPNAQGGLRFQDESAYAQGKARRPRRTIPKPSSSTAVVATRVTLLTPSRALTLSLDDHAFQYWAMTNVSQADTLHEAAHEWHTHVIPYWAKAKPGLCLQLAILTLSRAVFSRARRSPQALVQADRSYAQCLHRTQQAVSGKSNENMDELLLTAMMMGYFENIRYNTGVSETSVRKTDAVGSRFTNVFCHYEGAMGLLRIRRELGGMESDKTLDKVARRQIVSDSLDLTRIAADCRRYVLRFYGETQYQTGFSMAKTLVKLVRCYGWTLSWCGSLRFDRERFSSSLVRFLRCRRAHRIWIIWLILANSLRMIWCSGLSRCLMNGNVVDCICQMLPPMTTATTYTKTITTPTHLTGTHCYGSASVPFDSLSTASSSSSSQSACKTAPITHI